jgi:hypothetical protein
MQIYEAPVEYFYTYISTFYLRMLFLNSLNMVCSERLINTTKQQDKKETTFFTKIKEKRKTNSLYS